MPGIVGIITAMPRQRAEQELLQMVEALHHENFYVSGLWAEESLGVYVGWVALKGSFADGMPLRNERGDVVLVFSGEEFPEPGTAQRLKEKGHDLGTGGPSYLVHVSEEDSSFPAGLNGRFHGLLIDRNRRTAVLFNDRYGMHRVYYHKSKDAFYFAAEAKAILAVCPETRTLDRRAFGEFISCGCTLEGRSLFKDIDVLPGGSRWVFRRSSVIEEENYFRPQEWEDQAPLSQESYYSELRHVFSRNLSRYFQGQERVGMSLTAGLDTRMIMAWQRRAPGSLPSYTFGGPFRDSQDVTLGRQVATMCGQPHEVIRVDQEFLAQFPSYAERVVFLSDGCADVERAPDLYLNERVRLIAPIRMSGVYGGEVLRGVRTLKTMEILPGLFAPELHSNIRQAGETCGRLAQEHPVSFAVFKQAPWRHYGIMAPDQTQVSLRIPYLDNDLVRTVFRAPAPTRASSDVSLRLITDGNRDLMRIPTDRGVGENGWHLRGTFLRAHQEFLFKAEYTYDLGMPQWLARLDHAFSRLHLERLFLGTHRIFHFRVWYRSELARYLREMLLDPRSLSRPYLERRVLETVVQGHVRGHGNYTSELHKLLTLELIHRLFLDNTARYSAGERLGALVGAGVGR
jgi:asparagine synthase (glutamine-hydrolysing)